MFCYHLCVSSTHFSMNSVFHNTLLTRFLYAHLCKLANMHHVYRWFASQTLSTSLNLQMNLPKFPTENELKIKGVFDFLGQAWLWFVAIAGCCMAIYYLNPIIFGSVPTWKLFNECLLTYGMFNFILNWLATKWVGSFVREAHKNDPKLSEQVRYGTVNGRWHRRLILSDW